ncbi:unnamed protein product, partial [Didymodactylos carnosus]
VRKIVELDYIEVVPVRMKLVPREEMDFNKVASLLYNQKMEALEDIKDLLIDSDYISFHKKFVDHSQINSIWKATACLTTKLQEDDLFSQFKMELESLWKQYNVDDELDFVSTAQRLFDGDMDIFETIQDFMLEDNFKHFKNDFMKNNKFKEFWEARKTLKPTLVDPKYVEFRGEMIKLLEIERIPPNKIKQIIANIQSNEKLNTNWKMDILTTGNDNEEVKSKSKENSIQILKENKINESPLSRFVDVDSISDDDEKIKFENLKHLEKIMLGETNDYSEKLFLEIVPLDFDHLQEIIKQKLNNNNDESLLDIMLPYIINKVKKGIGLTEICELEIFWEESSPLYGMDYKTVF